MEIKKRKITGREKDQESIKLLNKLREELYSQHASNRRQAAFNLSWMQEDGLEMLQDALFGDFHVTTKNAATYGLRKMRGRMKNMALDVLKQGVKDNNKNTRDVCRNALLRLEGKIEKKPASKGSGHRNKFEIRDIPRGNRRQRTIGMLRDRRRGPIGNRSFNRD
ncbi:MAG: hypothetical protein FVQ85_15180 [Planctomycetes bacterium]|nr:hypothetical protein [Planctomycetota bacterium]